MNKTLFVFLIIFSFFLGNVNVNADQNINKVFKIESYTYDEFTKTYNMVQYGSAIYIKEGIIYTNAHVILDNEENPIGNYRVCKTIKFKDKPECFSIGELLYYDIKNDIAALKISNPGVDIIKNSRIKLNIGDTVKVYGYPSNGGETITYTEGKISGYENGYYKIDANIDAGNSGGGVFDLDGNLIGITVAVKVGYSTIGYIIPLSKINDFKIKKNINSIKEFNISVDSKFKKYHLLLKNIIGNNNFYNSELSIKEIDKIGFKINDYEIDNDNKFYSINLSYNDETYIEINNSNYSGKNNLSFERMYKYSYEEGDDLKDYTELSKYIVKKIKLRGKNTVLEVGKFKNGSIILGLAIEISQNHYQNIIIFTDNIKNKSFIKGVKLVLKSITLKNLDTTKKTINMKLDNLTIVKSNGFYIEKDINGDRLEYFGEDINIVKSIVLKENIESIKEFTFNSISKKIYNSLKDSIDYNFFGIKKTTFGDYYIYNFVKNNADSGKKYFIKAEFLDKKDTNIYYDNIIVFSFNNLNSKIIIDNFLKNIKTSSSILPIKLGDVDVGKNFIEEMNSSSYNNVENKTIKSNIKDDSYCSVEISGVTYKLEPCNINTSLEDGKGDKEFKFRLIPSDSNENYIFEFYGYGEGFPGYGILGGASSGGARGTQFFTKRFTDSVLDKGNYNGYLKLFISNSNGLRKELRLNINLDVK